MSHSVSREQVCSSQYMNSSHQGLNDKVRNKQMNPSINIVLCEFAFKVNLEHLITISHCFGPRQKSQQNLFSFHMNYFVHIFVCGLNNINWFFLTIPEGWNWQNQVVFRAGFFWGLSLWLVDIHLLVSSVVLLLFMSVSSSLLKRMPITLD